MAHLTPEEVDTLSPDIDEPVSKHEPRTHRLFRHWYFAHYCLGESWGDAAAMAAAFCRVPLPLSKMQEMAVDWNDDEVVS